MAKLTVLYWRDIPAEVLVRQGQQRCRAELAPRFAEAIDMAAMGCGARDGDAYLAGWRRGRASEVTGDLQAVAECRANELEAGFPPAKLKLLIDQGGIENAN